MTDSDFSTREHRETALRLAEELSRRRATDPLKSFPLHDKQKAFVSSVLEGRKKENWFIAANRSGKSDAGAYIGATLARFGRPQPRSAPFPGARVEVRDRATSGWVSALDFPTSRDVLQPKYFDNGYGVIGGIRPFIPSHEIESWSVDNQVLKLKNGSIIGFKSAESGRKKYQGAAKDWFHMDEEHPYDIYEESVIRVGNEPLIFFCTATILPPEGSGNLTVSWVFPKIIQPWKEGMMPYVGLFGASIYDNPGIDREEIRRLEAIYPEGSPARRIRLEGEWLPGMMGARAYPAFDRMIHVVNDMPEIAIRRPICWAWDFNVEPMVSLIGQIDGDVYNIHYELVLESGNIAEMCERFRQVRPAHGSEIWLYGDSTGTRRTGQTGKSDYWLIMNEMKQYGVPIRMRVPPENPWVPDRVNAVNRLCRDEEGQVRLRVSAACQELIADLEGVRRDDRGGIMKVRNRKDPYHKRTHTSDALGYWLAFDEPVRLSTPRGSGRKLPAALKGPNYGHPH